MHIAILISIIGMEIKKMKELKVAHSQIWKTRMRWKWLLWIYLICLWRMAPLRYRKDSRCGRIGLFL